MDRLWSEAEEEQEPEPPPPPPPDSCCRRLLGFLKLYWRSIVSILWPLLWLPLLITHFFENDYRCLYLVIVMAAYWVTECIPLPITSCLPMFYFPIMGISNSKDICMVYFNATNVMFIGSVMIALSVRHCNLHYRIALFVMLCVGCSPRRLHLGVMLITNFLSWWMQNTACTAMMCPILFGVLSELEKQGMCPIYKPSENDDNDDNITKKVPTKNTIAFYLAAAYASTLGGCATLVGTDTNLVYRGLFEDFEKAHNITKPQGINFSKFMGVNAPIMFIANLMTWLVLQVMYMGLFRPNSESAALVRKGKELQHVARNVLKEKFTDLGPMSWHESWVLFLFVTTILLWFFRDPGFMTGWHVIGQGTEVADAVVCIFIILLLFLIPAKPTCFKSFSLNRDERPEKHSEGLITWQVLHEQTPWGLMLLLGGGFALAKASGDSGMSKLVSGWLSKMNVLPTWLIMSLCAILTSFMTELSANVAIANIVLPIALQLAYMLKVDLLYLTMPTALASSFAFILPVGTPPNALVAGFVNIPTSEMAKTGIIVSILVVLLYIGGFVSYGRLFYNF